VLFLACLRSSHPSHFNTLPLRWNLAFIPLAASWKPPCIFNLPRTGLRGSQRLNLTRHMAETSSMRTRFRPLGSEDTVSQPDSVTQPRLIFLCFSHTRAKQQPLPRESGFLAWNSVCPQAGFSGQQCDGGWMMHVIIMAASPTNTSRQAQPRSTHCRLVKCQGRETR
jgi:hypothetical protein